MNNSGIDIINSSIEDITRQLMNAETHPKVIAVIIQLHEQQRLLQNGVNELIHFYDEMLKLQKLTQALHKENSAKMSKILKRYSDPNREAVAHVEGRELDD